MNQEPQPVVERLQIQNLLSNSVTLQEPRFSSKNLTLQQPISHSSLNYQPPLLHPSKHQKYKKRQPEYTKVKTIVLEKPAPLKQSQDQLIPRLEPLSSHRRRETNQK